MLPQPSPQLSLSPTTLVAVATCVGDAGAPQRLRQPQLTAVSGAAAVEVVGVALGRSVLFDAVTLRSPSSAAASATALAIADLSPGHDHGPATAAGVAAPPPGNALGAAPMPGPDPWERGPSAMQFLPGSGAGAGAGTGAGAADLSWAGASPALSGVGGRKEGFMGAVSGTWLSNGYAVPSIDVPAPVAVLPPRPRAPYATVSTEVVAVTVPPVPPARPSLSLARAGDVLCLAPPAAQTPPRAATPPRGVHLGSLSVQSPVATAVAEAYSRPGDRAPQADAHNAVQRAASSVAGDTLLHALGRVVR